MDRTDIARCPSPDGRGVAVWVWEKGGGAAGTASKYLYLQNAGDPTLKSPQWETAVCDNVSLSWKGHSLLQVSDEAGCSIQHFYRFWTRDIHSLDARRVDIA